MDSSAPLQRQHQSQRHGHADTKPHPVNFLKDVLVGEVSMLGLAKMADAEEDDDDSQSAAWDDDVETDPPRRIVRNGSTEEWPQSESHGLDPAGDGAEYRTVFQRRGMSCHAVQRSQPLSFSVVISWM